MADNNINIRIEGEEGLPPDPAPPTTPPKSPSGGAGDGVSGTAGGAGDSLFSGRTASEYESSVLRAIGRSLGRDIGQFLGNSQIARYVGAAFGSTTGQQVFKAIFGGSGASNSPSPVGGDKVGASTTGVSGAAGNGALAASLTALLSPIGMLTASLAVVGSAVGALTYAMENVLAKELAGLNSTIAGSQADATLRELDAKITQADQLEDELAGFIDAQTDVSVELRELQTNFIEIFGPGVEALLRIVSLLTRLINTVVGTARASKAAWDGLLSVALPVIGPLLVVLPKINRWLGGQEERPSDNIQKELLRMGQRFKERDLQPRDFRLGVFGGLGDDEPFFGDDE